MVNTGGKGGSEKGSGSGRARVPCARVVVKNTNTGGEKIINQKKMKSRTFAVYWLYAGTPVAVFGLPSLFYII